MQIEYKTTKNFSADALQDLFLAVKWESGRFPEKLRAAMQNSATVFSAWDGEKLIGLVNALDDGIITAYVHFLLVAPDYQSNGIGKELLRRVAEKYENYLRIVLISDEKEIAFYEANGFSHAKGTAALFINKF